MNANMPEIHTLNRECRIYMSYLVQGVPDRYILEKYRHAHEVSEVLCNLKPNNSERMLIGVSSRHRALTRLVDVYTRVFYSKSLVRKKLTLLLSLLECSPTWHGFFGIRDRAVKANPYLGMMSRALAFPIVLSVATILLFPIHMGCVITSILFRRES